MGHQADDAAEAVSDSATQQADDLAETATDSVAGQTDDAAGAVSGAGDRVDDTWLKDAPHGSDVPVEKINQAGWSQQEAEAMQKVAREEGVESALAQPTSTRSSTPPRTPSQSM